MEEFITLSEKETIEAGKKFAKNLKLGDVVALYGDLGSGKTQFIKGICEFFHVAELVTSPTFTIINQYKGKVSNKRFPIYHLDLYRIKNENELMEIGFDECIFADDSIKLVEWSENAAQLLPTHRYSIEISSNGDEENYRKITIQPH